MAEHISQTELATIRKLLDEHIRPSPAQVAALLDEVERLSVLAAEALNTRAQAEAYRNRPVCKSRNGHRCSNTATHALRATDTPALCWQHAGNLPKVTP